MKTLLLTLTCLFASSALADDYPLPGKDFDPQELMEFDMCLSFKFVGGPDQLPHPIPGEWITASVTNVFGSGGHTHEAVDGIPRPNGVWKTITSGIPGESQTRQKTGPDGCVQFLYKGKGWAGEITVLMAPENPVFTHLAKWRRHNLIVKDYDIIHDTKSALGLMSNSDGFWQSFQLQTDTRHKNSAGENNQSRFLVKSARQRFSNIARRFANSEFNGSHILLNLMHAGCRDGGICDSEFGYLGFSPLLPVWQFRPNKRYMDGFDGDIENPMKQAQSSTHAILLWNTFVADTAEEGCRLSKYDPYGVLVPGSEGTAMYLYGGYWAGQDVIHVVCSSPRGSGTVN